MQFTMIDFIDGLLSQSKSVTLRGVEIDGVRIDEIFIAPRKPRDSIEIVGADTFDEMFPGVGRLAFHPDAPVGDPPPDGDRFDDPPPPHLVEAAVRLLGEFGEADGHPDPFIRAIVYLTKDCDSVKANASEWLKSVEDCTPASGVMDAGFPNTVEQFGAALNRFQPQLMQLGLDIIRHPAEHGRKLIEIKRRADIEAVA